MRAQRGLLRLPGQFPGRIQPMWTILVAAIAMVLVPSVQSANAQTPDPETALKYRPSQLDVEYDRPAPADVKRCRVELEKRGNQSGFVVFDPNGQVLRRYIDVNGDRYIDQWRYYSLGIEVYRDIDSDYNNKIDQFRWINTGGTRWGVDKNEDGRVDVWRRLSAEEASRVAIEAMTTGNAALLSTVLISADDLNGLGVSAELQQQLLQRVREPEATLKTIMASSTTVTSKSKWQRFDVAMPSLIPADDGKATSDLEIYSGAMAIVMTGEQHGFVPLGELIRVGEVWKLTQIPRPSANGVIEVSLGGLLMQPATSSGAIATELSPEMQKLIEQLQSWDQAAPQPDAERAVITRYLSGRNAIIEKLVALARPGEEFDTWMKQFINGLTSQVQMGDENARARLVQVRSQLQQKNPRSELVAYASYRQLLAEYSTRTQTAKTQDDQQQIQTQFLKELSEFVDTYPGTEDTADAIMQLGMNAELTNNGPAAQRWYTMLTTDDYRSMPVAARAAGALRRIGLQGLPLDLSGPDTAGREVSIATYRGRLTLVVFWATWSQQFVKDVPVLRAMHEQYNARGFEIVGVNLDEQPAAATNFARQNKVAWPSIHQAGALDSPLAEQFGILTVPTMFLVDRDGKVVSSNLTMNDLKERLAESFKATP